MLGTVRLFFDATVAVALMATFAIISGFAAAAITGDRMLIIVTASSVFTVTGALLLVRLWRMTHGPGNRVEPGT